MFKFSPHSLRHRGGPRSGQALLIAVLLMSVILLVGILFAAVVSFNQEQSSRHLDLVAAQLQADAGINYASRMLENSPQGADWRPRFVAYSGTGSEQVDDQTTWPKDPSLWPSPPAKYEDGSADFNFFGPDGIEGTEDDYYSDFEIVRGWFPLRHGSPGAPGDFVRMGFFRFPDPNQVAAGNGSMDATTIGRGYFLLQVTFDPDPPYEPGDPSNQDRMSGATRIVSIGRSVEESNVFRRVVAYKPVGLMDHMRWITNKTGQASDAVLGVRANVDMDASKTWSPNESLHSYLPGPVRSEVPLYWAGQQVSSAPSTLFRLYTGPAGNEGYLRDDYVYASRGLYSLDDPDSADGAAIQLDGPTGAQTLLPLKVDQDAAVVPTRVRVGSRDIPPLAPPDLEASDPTSGVSRYHALTRDSGQMMRATADPDSGIVSGDPVNTGYYGGGQGLYISNFNDIQFPDSKTGRSDLSLLEADWLKTPAGTGSVGPWSGWNPLFSTYTPAGVEIEFFPTEAAVLRTSTGGVYSATPPTSTGTLWWPRHVAGEPGIKITRHDRNWRWAEGANGPWSFGDDTGQSVMVVDYPRYPNAVIMAEGNVRVKGILPERERPDHDRSYDVTLVSNATIYIDGQLMTAQDRRGRRAGTNLPAADGVLDEDTAKIALLARDSVCLNPTQIVPQLTRNAPARPDDEATPTLADQHWELGASPDQQASTQWRFGWPDIDWDGNGIGDGVPGTNIPAGVKISVTPIHTGADPGPSGMAMTVANESTAPTPVPYVFNPSVVDQFVFIFLPPGALYGAIPSPDDAISNAILPNWQAPGITPMWDTTLPTPGWRPSFANPQVPFDVDAYITRDIGQNNMVQLSYRDPQVGAGATAYLLKKWKIEETTNYTDSDSNTWQMPRGAVHAKINALMYAQRGSWFVIPGTYFDPQATAVDQNLNSTTEWQESVYASRFRRYNYEITVRGAIVEDHTAPIGAVQTWTNRWAYPVWNTSGSEPVLSWGTLRYQFDDRLRMNRDQALTTLTGSTRSSGSILTTPESMLPKLPCLPSSPTLIYTGG